MLEFVGMAHKAGVKIVTRPQTSGKYAELKPKEIHKVKWPMD